MWWTKMGKPGRAPRIAPNLISPVWGSKFLWKAEKHTAPRYAERIKKKEQLPLMVDNSAPEGKFIQN